MPAHDVFHAAVKNGLIKDGWTITDDPLSIEFDLTNFYIDLTAERLIGAEKAGERIAVEVKSFLGPSLVTDFHAALGQFLNYRIVLDETDPDRVLFLAVSEPTYTAFFENLLAKIAVRRHGVNLIIYDPDSGALVQWIKQGGIVS
jgi:hypothetical protein